MQSPNEGDPVPLESVNWAKWDNQGLWGTWHYSFPDEFPLAYDWVYPRVSAGDRTLIENNLLRYTVEFYLKISALLYYFNNDPETGRAPFGFGNMDGKFFSCIIPYGKVCEPEFIHFVVSNKLFDLFLKI